jgi:hypothetical protein
MYRRQCAAKYNDDDVFCLSVCLSCHVLRQEVQLRPREARAGLTGTAPLQAYMCGLRSFWLSCIKTWLLRRQDVEAGGSGRLGDPQAVPCVRFCLDWRPCQQLMVLTALMRAAAPGSVRFTGNCCSL